VPVVSPDKRRFDLSQAAEVDLVDPGQPYESQQILDVARVLQHHFHAVLFELPDQFADSASPELRHESEVRGQGSVFVRHSVFVRFMRLPILQYHSALQHHSA
jgi:hypothetical protein